MGSLGTVGNARNLLEKMYKAPSSDKKKSWQIPIGIVILRKVHNTNNDNIYGS
jgi:hypothetical protein